MVHSSEPEKVNLDLLLVLDMLMGFDNVVPALLAMYIYIYTVIPSPTAVVAFRDPP